MAMKQKGHLATWRRLRIGKKEGRGDEGSDVLSLPHLNSVRNLLVLD